ncbi:MAG: hypothetical protein E7Z91_02230 [Cyanobacteria bacterium SIG30]|nr:hypothetical protein [Cyanobacteria bacterium SIG30]
MPLENIKELEYNLKNIIKDYDALGLADFLCLPSKRLRPLIIFLVLRMLDLQITEKHKKLALAVELLHSATLIHDDILDDAILRRGQKTLNKKFNSKLAVLGGDYLLSLALNEIAQIENPKVLEIFSDNIKAMVSSEIDQYFARGELINLEEYLKKNINKTALLFLSGVKSALVISNYDNHLTEIENFVLNFGLAFQIINDLNSIEDDKNEIYTICNILGGTKNKPDCDIIKMANEFVLEIIKKANSNLNFVDNKYKKELCEILLKLKEK